MPLFFVMRQAAVGAMRLQRVFPARKKQTVIDLLVGFHAAGDVGAVTDSFEMNHARAWLVVHLLAGSAHFESQISIFVVGRRVLFVEHA